MKSNTTVIALLAAIIGLFVGYVLGGQTMPQYQMMRDDAMYEEMGEHADEMMSDGAMQHAMEEMSYGLRGKDGESYERAFLEMMIVHHIGAINMAEELLTKTNRPELVQMGNDIIRVQTEEVAMMRGWLSDWFNVETVNEQ